MKKFEKYINTFDLIEWIINTFPNWCEGDVRQIVDYIEGLEDRSVGEWVIAGKNGHLNILECSECGHREFNHYNFCSNCGANMRKEK